MTALRQCAAALVAWLALVALPASAQSFPPFTGLVVDAAGVLPPQTRADLTAKLEALQRDTHRQLVVATIPDLQGYPIEDYGYRLGRAWGVGLREVDNGAILFVAPNEPKGQRGPRIEVGLGLEPVLTDALAGQIIRRQMLPRLRANSDVAGAMEAGTDAIIAQLRASPDEAKARTDAAVREFDRTHRRSGGGEGIPIGLIFWLFVIGFVMLSSLRGRGKRRRGGGGIWPVVMWGPGWGGGGGSSWGGGGSSGGGGGWGGGSFTGGGGGSFGGGGASGDW